MTTYKPISRTVREWTEFVAANKTSTDAYTQELVGLIEAGIVAACDRCKCSVDMLPFNLRGQRLTVDVPAPAK
jgi:hypothetical protein